MKTKTYLGILIAALMATIYFAINGLKDQPPKLESKIEREAKWFDSVTTPRFEKIKRAVGITSISGIVVYEDMGIIIPKSLWYFRTQSESKQWEIFSMMSADSAGHWIFQNPSEKEIKVEKVDSLLAKVAYEQISNYLNEKTTPANCDVSDGGSFIIEKNDGSQKYIQEIEYCPGDDQDYKRIQEIVYPKRDIQKL